MLVFGANNSISRQYITELDPYVQKIFGQGGAEVLHSTERLKSNKHFVYFNNFSCIIQLIISSSSQKIHAVGTVHVPRFSNPPLN